MALVRRVRPFAVFVAALVVTLLLAPTAEAQRRRRARGERREDISRLPVVNAGPTYVDFPESGQSAIPRRDPGPDVAVPVPVPAPADEPAAGRRRHRHGGRHHRRH